MDFTRQSAISLTMENRNHCPPIDGSTYHYSFTLTFGYDPTLFDFMSVYITKSEEDFMQPPLAYGEKIAKPNLGAIVGNCNPFNNRNEILDALNKLDAINNHGSCRFH